MRTVACDLCGSSETVLLFMLPDQRFPTGTQSFRLVECRGCGLIYLNPRPEAEELASYYPEPFYQNLEAEGVRARRRSSLFRRLRKRVRRALLERCYRYPSVNSGTPERRMGMFNAMTTVLLHLERWRLQVIGREAAIVPFIGQGRLLDVGCGTGEAMASLKELGWEVTGVEVSPYAASRARHTVGCEVLVGDFEQVPLGEERFDVIRFCHSLEHVPSPKRTLEKAHRLLQPGGFLWIEIPNAASVERWIFGMDWFAWEIPRHLYHFTPETLAHLLVCTGFRPIKARGDGRSLVFAESLANLLARRFALRPHRTKLISALAKPLTMALGSVNSSSIMFVHAQKVSVTSPDHYSGSVMEPISHDGQVRWT